MNQSTSFAQVANNLLNVLQGYTKGIRVLVVLTMLLIVGIGQAWGETVTISGIDTWSGGQSGGGKALYITKEGITINISSGYKYSNTEIRWYSGAIMSVSSEVGNITQMKFTISSNASEVTVPNNSSGSYSNQTWTGDSNDFTLKSTKQVKWSSVTITYTPSGGGSACTEPTVVWNKKPSNGEMGGSMTASVTTNYSNGLAYSSSNQAVATVTNAGVIKYLAAGTTTITATVTGDGTTICEGPVSVQQEITVTAPAGGGSGGDGECIWELVTDASTLKTDDEVIITASGNNNYALSTNQKSSNRGATIITKNGNTLTSPSADVQILALKAGSTSGTWAFYTGTSGYLYAASSSGNQLKTKTTLDIHGSWTISITDGVASIAAKGSSNRNVMQYNYNNGSPLFACYSSASQTSLAIYKKVCATETTYSVTAGTVQNGSIKFSKTGEGEFTDTQLTGLEEGDYAHFVVNPTLGYTLSGAPSVKDASDNNVECVDMDGIWMFEMPASNVTVSASCTLKEYKITIDDEEKQKGTASATHSVAVMGTSITLTPEPATGYQFKSWNVTKEGDETITVTNDQFTMPASDVTVSAEFTPIIYTITYKNDEYINYISATPETITIEDKGFELEYSVEDGYELTGVTVTMGGEELVLEEEYLWDKTSMLILPKIDVTGNIVVTFETVATCTQPPTISAATSSDITQTTAMLSCSGISSLGSAGCSITSYGFVWGTTTNPTTSNNKVQVGTTYTTTGTAFSNKLTGLTANTTYYVRPYATNGNGTAYGTEISFKTLDLVKLTTPTNLSVSNLSCSGVTLAWDKVDGASSYQLIRTDKSTSSPITTKVDQKDNPSVYCTLSAGTSWSWTVQAIGDGLTYNSSEVATGEDFTLHYTINYNENGGSTVGDDCGTTLPSELPTTTKSHHTFAGWYMDKELNTPAEAGSVINTNTTLYAKWEEIKFTITWSINENTTNSQELQEGTTITPPADPEAATYACEDKVFVGWVGESIGGSTNEEPDFITDFGNVKENKTYYAVFATPSGNGFTLGQSGDFTIYANVDGTNYYATGKIGATNNGKIVGTTEEGDANVYTFTAISGNNESYTYNIKQGDKFLKYDSSTDLASTNDSYTWTISQGTKGSWRIAASTNGRAIIFRYDSKLFGGYATSNFSQNQSTYYDIEIGGATTYTEYVTSCVTCENVLTISKGNEENGTFTLDKVGEQETCDGLSVLVTPTHAEHYHVASVTASTGENGVNNGDGTYTITYAANSTGESTINVVFEEDTKFDVTWYVNGIALTGVELGEASTKVYENDKVEKIPDNPAPPCGGMFVGWTVAEMDVDDTDEPNELYTQQSEFPDATDSQTFYAVFADYKN